MLLQRLTTEYVDLEDRIRLSGSLDDGTARVLWLTRRLLERLLPHLLGWLEEHTRGALDGELLQSFAQDAARAAITPQPPVVAEEASIQSLVVMVDLQRHSQNVVLSFKDRDGLVQGQLALETTAMRQWLGILQDVCCRGGWPLDVWPDWMATAKEAETSASRLMH